MQIRFADKLFVIALLLCAGSSLAMAREVFVAPTGNDAADGTKDKPVATMARARDLARTSKQLGQPTTVILRGGVYYLPDPLVLSSEDSGSKESPVIWRTAEGEQAVISGGLKLDLKWEPFKDGIFSATVPAGLESDQLFVNGERQILARYPNYDPKIDIYNGHAADCISPARAKRWADPAGGFMHAMHTGQWGGFSYLITGKDENNVVKYVGGWQGNRASGPHPSLRFVENIFEELDAPGEWFLNTKTHTLYFMPPAGLDLARAVIEMPRLKALIEFRGTEQAPVKWITFRGLIFRHTLRTFMETKEPLLRSDWTVYRGGAIFFNGAEDCTLEDSFLDQLGGNTVFINNYNRRVLVRGCRIEKSGAGGVTVVGDPKAVRSPLFEYGKRLPLEKIDRTPGPLTNNYPADCRVEDCLITQTGRVEKQSAGVGIDMAARITITHCSIYDMPRAGINIGDGCWGGHVVEYCDVFDTIKETGDHGSFNSWGRDRYWGVGDSNKVVQANPELPLLDVVELITLRNTRWRCDHGWDIDLDDGSSNYRVYNNLCLSGGIKHREGYARVCRNNIMVNNSFHPHVWFEKSGDVFTNNIVMRQYAPIGMPKVWGKQIDNNLLHTPGQTEASAAAILQKQSGQDEHSLAADAMFIDPTHGDFRVSENSPALKLGFENFPMDQFGVTKPALRALARTPEFSQPAANAAPPAVKSAKEWQTWLGAKIKTVSSLGEVSATGLASQAGVLLLEVPEASAAAKAGLKKLDVILACNGKETKKVDDLFNAVSAAAGQKLQFNLWRNQQAQPLDLTDYVFVVTESQNHSQLTFIPLAPKPTIASISVNGQTTNDPLGTLTDGELARGYGPVFGNGTTDGKYKLDLKTSQSVVQINTWSFNMGGNRGHQKFTLYGSNSSADPGWDTTDAKKFNAITDVATAGNINDFVATSIRHSGGAPLGSFRWLVWAVAPVTENAGGENTAFQEFQVVSEEAK